MHLAQEKQTVVVLEIAITDAGSQARILEVSEYMEPPGGQ